MSAYQKVRELLLAGRRVSALENKIKDLQYKSELLSSQQQQLLNHLQHVINGQNLIIVKLSEEKINYHLEDPVPTFPDVKSQLCTYDQMLTQKYLEWCRESSGTIKTLSQRKYWEFCYILQALEESGKLTQGSKGLGFAVGLEPLPAMLVRRGCSVVATDLDTETAIEKGWTKGEVQHADNLRDLNKHQICPQELFNEKATFRFVNMNHIPEDLKGFDFLWSSCSLEHLGSIDAGIRYIIKAMDCLKPGGVAVHTTEYNLSSDLMTLDNSETVIFRKRDILQLKNELESAGYQLAPLTFNAGRQPQDQFIDIPPYKQHDSHLKLLLSMYVTTSIGLIIRKM